MNRFGMPPFIGRRTHRKATMGGKSRPIPMGNFWFSNGENLREAYDAKNEIRQRYCTIMSSVPVAGDLIPSKEFTVHPVPLFWLSDISSPWSSPG
ncbi:MAG: hypothetical protein LBJ13_00605 [Puniceicoccales bacterium]|nr:hypothetical protein [Puniceicoccales bacterium]